MTLQGLSDPYVVLAIGKANSKSKPVDKNLSPKWGSSHKLGVTSPSSDKLELTVFDKDSIFSKVKYHFISCLLLKG
jgi:Ca2+-dependent lipid-binding protein